jgi:hypothetical protein
MKEIFKEAIRDVAFFFIGLSIGVLIECSYQFIVKPLTKNNIIIFAVGILQLFVNAIIINYSKYIYEHSGFFTMGVLSPQLLLVRKLINDKINY